MYMLQRKEHFKQHFNAFLLKHNSIITNTHVNKLITLSAIFFTKSFNGNKISISVLKYVLG